MSMPEGQLADSNVGWDGEWFVIERRVRRGPRVVEKFRLLKTGQLEYLMNWGGDTELAGIKTRRVFDRAAMRRRPPRRIRTWGPRAEVGRALATSRWPETRSARVPALWPGASS